LINQGGEKNMNDEEPEGINQNDEDAFEQLTEDSPLLGNDEGYTLDVEEFKRRLIARKNKLLENPIVNEVKSGGSDKESQDVSNEYPIVEGKRRLKVGTDNSGEPKSPLQ